MTKCNDHGRKTGQAPVSLFSAPWKLKAETYVLFLKLNTLPKGVYDVVEEKQWDDNKLGQFVGGLGAIMIVRYSHSPSGKSLFPSRKSFSELLLAAKVVSLPTMRIRKEIAITFRDIRRENACFNGSKI